MTCIRLGKPESCDRLSRSFPVLLHLPNPSAGTAWFSALTDDSVKSDMESPPQPPELALVALGQGHGQRNQVGQSRVFSQDFQGATGKRVAGEVEFPQLGPVARRQQRLEPASADAVVEEFQPMH